MRVLFFLLWKDPLYTVFSESVNFNTLRNSFKRSPEILPRDVKDHLPHRCWNKKLFEFQRNNRAACAKWWPLLSIIDVLPCFLPEVAKQMQILFNKNHKYILFVKDFNALHQASLCRVFSDFHLMTSISIGPIKMSSIS